jgi:phytoene dehydrogenase-like protein
VSQRHDTIVIGAGPNGLTTAALLARRGRRVLLLERRERIGGLAAAEPFHPGYRSAGLHHDTRGLRPGVVRALDLERHGLRLRDRPPDLLALGDGSDTLLLRGESTACSREIARRSEHDAARYLEFRAFVERIRPVVAGFLDGPPLDVVGLEPGRLPDLFRRALRLRRLGRREMLELLRLPPMTAADWLDEWFETGALKAALALPAVAGTRLGPRSPGSNANQLLALCGAGTGPVGGGPTLIDALANAARDAGVEIRTGTPVTGLLLDGGAIRGVEADGACIPAARVVASCDPKHTLLELLPPGLLTSRLEHRLESYRMRGSTAWLLLALDRPVRFNGRDDEPVEFARTGVELDEIERAHDAIKYRTFCERPVLDIHVPTVSNPELAPPGSAVLSVLVHFAPHDEASGWDPAARERLTTRVMSILERAVVDLGTSIVGRELLTPVDLETRYGVTGGQIHHGEHALDQLLVRPAPECSEYRTPVAGLYLCGSGCHPGGGLTCAPGARAAESILAG